MFFLEINLNYYSSAHACCSLVCDVVASCSCSCSFRDGLPTALSMLTVEEGSESLDSTFFLLQLIFLILTKYF